LLFCDHLMEIRTRRGRFCDASEAYTEAKADSISVIVERART
jgi:hypothetical protein